MATQPQPAAMGAPDQGAPQSLQAPADPTQIMLAQLFQACRKLAEQNPVLAGGLGKAAQGIQEAQTALITSPQSPQPTESNPPY